MADKPLQLVSGRSVQVELLVSSAGAGDSGKGVAVDATGRLDTSFMPVGIGADTKSVITSENLAAGDMVNIYDNASTANARKADATAEGKECHGFVLAATTSPAEAIVFFEGVNTQLSGLTVGARQYLDAATPGGTVETALSATGNVHQLVGVAISATEMSFEAAETITIA